jgi:hypothetical protein
MKTKFKILTLLVLPSMLLGLAACGEQATPTPIAVSDLADITLSETLNPV